MSISPVFFSSYKQIRASYQCDCFTHIKKECPGPEFSWPQWGRARTYRIKYYNNMPESRGFLVLPQKVWHVGIEVTAAGRSHGIWFFTLHSISRHGGFSRLGKCMDKACSQSRSPEAQQNHCVLCRPKPVLKHGKFWAI